MASPHRRLALAWLAGFTLIDTSIVVLALPDIAAEFDRSIADLAWVSTGYLLALAATLLAAGRLSDRVGARSVLTAGAIGFLVATLLSGLAPTYGLLLAARVVQGVFGGVLYTVSLAITATAFPPERRATAISIYFTSGALAAVLGPLVGGFLTDVGGWRLVFLAQLPLPAAVAVMAWLTLPSQRGHATGFDVPGVAAASIFVAAATWAMLELPVAGSAVSVSAAVGVAAIALAAFAWRERVATDPAVDLAIFGNRRFVVSTVAGAGAWFAILATTTYAAIYLQLGRGVPSSEAGLLVAAGPVVALILFPFSGVVVGRLGVDRTLLAGLAGTVASAVLRLTWDSVTPIPFVAITNLLAGFGIALTLVSSATDALSQFSPERAGTGSAVFNSIRQLGAAMGVALPAVAFELVAGGSRTAPAVLGGSTAAFTLQLVVLAIPLALVATRWLPVRRRDAATA